MFIFLPEHQWLAWLLYSIAVYMTCWQIQFILLWLKGHENITLLQRYKPAMMRHVFYIMLLPCLLISSAGVWWAPAFLVLLLAIVNVHIGHLLFAILSFGVYFYLRYYYFKNRERFPAMRLALSARYPLITRIIHGFAFVTKLWRPLAPHFDKVIIRMLWLNH